MQEGKAGGDKEGRREGVKRPRRNSMVEIGRQTKIENKTYLN